MIARELFDAYSTALLTNDAMARRELLEFIGYVGFNDYSTLRDSLLEGFPALVAKYGDRAAQVAIEFYQEQRAASGVEEPYTPTLVAQPDAKVARADVRRSMGSLYDGAGHDAFMSTMAGYMTKRVMGQADEQLWDAMERDMVRGKACLVPHAGACGWCVLIASRGWDLDRRIENMRHDNCKCTLVIDWGDPALAGYDEMDYYRIYRDADSVENQKKWVSEWNAMNAEERQKYSPGTFADRRKGETSAKSGWKNYRRNRVIQTMNESMGITSSSRIK